MLPVVDTGGRIYPVLHRILFEAGAAGVERAALVVSPDQQEIFQQYLSAVKDIAREDFPETVEMIVQPEPKGFGEAVLRGRAFAGGDDAIAVMLGDHVHTHGPSGPCLRQVVGAFDDFGGAAMVAMQPIGPDRVSHVGVARGQRVENDDGRRPGQRVYRCEELIEKPTVGEARARLVTPGLAAGRFLAHAGLYVFAAEIFDVLAEAPASDSTGEIELTDAQAELLRRHPREYYLLQLDGRGHDTGTPAAYAAAFAAFASGAEAT